MSDDNAVGIADYRAGAAPSRASLLLQAIRKRIELKAALALESARIEAMLPTLSESEIAEVRAALANDDARLDDDVAALQEQAADLAAEAAAARSAKGISVPLSKTASRILAEHIQRKLELGYCPPVELLTEQAIRQAYGQA